MAQMPIGLIMNFITNTKKKIHVGPSVDGTYQTTDQAKMPFE